MTHEIVLSATIQWNCRGYTVNYDELLLLIAEVNPTAICLLETFKKDRDKPNIKTFEQYDYIHGTRQRALGEVSIIMRKNIPLNKININTYLQAIAVSATLHKTPTIYSQYLPPHDPINENELNDLIEQIPKPLILMGDFNNHNIIWGSKSTNKRSKKKSSIAIIYASAIRTPRPTLTHPQVHFLS